MIRLLSGVVRSVDVGNIVVDVNGVGYSVATVGTEYIIVGEPITLHTHLAVRENALDLYGFTDPFSLECFEALLTVPQIGPKSALAVLISAPAELIAKSVVDNNPTSLQTLGGVGKKTAERIVQQLHERWQPSRLDNTVTANESIHHAYALEALMTLGYERTRAIAFLRDYTESPDDLNMLIKKALQQM